MVFRYEYKGGVWVDLERPSDEEVRQVLNEFSISTRFGDELLSPTPSPLVARDDGATLLVLHFPTPGKDNGDTKSQEIDFIVGMNFIITVRYDLIIPLHHLKKLLETETLASGEAPDSTDVLLEVLFSHLYSSVQDHVNHCANELTQVERDMLEGHERKTVRAISDISRDFLHLEATLVTHEEPLVRFLKSLTRHEVFGQSFEDRVVRIAAERAHTAHLVRTYRAVATELRETNLALLEVRQNEIMQTLTIITVVVLPLELIAVTFGIHAPGTPFENDPNLFLIIIGIMTAIVVIMLSIFVRKRWLS